MNAISIPIPPPMTKQPLTDEQARRLLVAAALYWRTHGEAPTWREVRVAAGLSRMVTLRLLRRMKRRGLVDYNDDEFRSLRVTDAGVRFALRRDR